MPLLPRLTNPIRSKVPAVPRKEGLLVRVNVTDNRPLASQEDTTDPQGYSASEAVWDERDLFGDTIYKKQNQILRIGYQNIGGLPFSANSIKDDIIRQGINAWEFDIFGLSETNVIWRLIPEQHKLFFRTKSWWENTHISHAHNVALPPVSRKQFGGVALFSTGPSVRRIIGKGVDKSLLGHWSWTLYHGKNNHLLKIYSAY
jgi:hypothetical protein